MVVHVSKMVSIPNLLLAPADPRHPSRCGNEDETLLAFARVFCGVLRPNSRVFVLSAKYDPTTALEGLTRTRTPNPNPEPETRTRTPNQKPEPEPEPRTPNPNPNPNPEP